MSTTQTLTMLQDKIFTDSTLIEMVTSRALDNVHVVHEWIIPGKDTRKSYDGKMWLENGKLVLIYDGWKIEASDIAHHWFSNGKLVIELISAYIRRTLTISF